MNKIDRLTQVARLVQCVRLILRDSDQQSYPVRALWEGGWNDNELREMCTHLFEIIDELELMESSVRHGA